MAALWQIKKDPNAVEPLSIDWSEWLAQPDGTTTIASQNWYAFVEDADGNRTSTSDITFANQSINAGNTATSVRVSGGTLGSVYWATNRVTAANGTVTERSIRLVCADY